MIAQQPQDWNMYCWEWGENHVEFIRPHQAATLSNSKYYSLPQSEQQEDAAVTWTSVFNWQQSHSLQEKAFSAYLLSTTECPWEWRINIRNPSAEAAVRYSTDSFPTGTNLSKSARFVRGNSKQRALSLPSWIISSSELTAELKGAGRKERE